MRKDTNYSSLTLASYGVAPVSRYEVEVDEYKLSKEGIDRVDKLTDEQFEIILRDIELNPTAPPKELKDDEWEPLPLDRESSEAKTAIEKSEIALKEIENSNGYAASAPEERNGIVETIKGTLAAIKTGFPSRQAIVAGLIAPFKFIAKKFGEASMGELATQAVAALVKWLAS